MTVALRGDLAYPRGLYFPLDHRQDGGDQPAHVGKGQQGVRPWLLVRHDHQAPELHRGVGQGLGPGGDDAVPQGRDLGQCLLAPPADLGPVQDMGCMGPRGVPACTGFLNSRRGSNACL